MIWIYIIIEGLIRGEFRLDDYSAKLWLMSYGAALPDSVSLLLGTLAYQKDRSGFTALISFMSIVYSFLAD